jgi:tetratricopeptide (TPR) repeat protein
MLHKRYHADEVRDFNEVRKSQAIRAAPDDVLGYFNLAVLFEDRGIRTGAIDMYQQVLNHEPEYQDAHHNVSRLYEAEGRYTDASDIIRRPVSSSKEKSRFVRQNKPPRTVASLCCCPLSVCYATIVLRNTRTDSLST